VGVEIGDTRFAAKRYPAGRFPENCTSTGTFFCAEYHGTIGGAVGPLVVAVGSNGKYVYSLNDGATWAVSADISVHSTVLSHYAR